MHKHTTRFSLRLLPLILLAVVWLWACPDRAQASVQTQIRDYLIEELDLTPAAACGIMANMKVESGFTAGLKGSSGLGLCQWTGVRRSRLISFCNNRGLSAYSVTGQLQFVAYELRNTFPQLLKKLQSYPNTAAGAYNAGYQFCYYYEAPSSLRYQSSYRASLAQSTMWPQYGSTALYLTGTSTLKRVKLTWSGDSTYRYAVMRSTAKNGTYKQIALLDSTVRSYVDRTCAAGNTYYYKICQVKKSGAAVNASNVYTAVLIRYLSNCTVKLSRSRYVYNGKRRTPAVTVTYGNTTLTQGVDYTVTYRNCIRPGTARAVIRGLGGYSGTLRLGYTIRKAKQNLTVKNQTVTWSQYLTLETGAVGTVTYGSANSAVAVSCGTKLRLVKSGVVRITVYAAETDCYQAASRTIRLTIRPRAPKVRKVWRGRLGALRMTLRFFGSADGVEVEYSKSRTFTSSKVVTDVAGGKWVQMRIRGVSRKAGGYLRIRGYVLRGGRKVYGPATIYTVNL